MTAFAAPPRVSELDQLSAAKFGPFGLRAGRRVAGTLLRARVAGR